VEPWADTELCRSRVLTRPHPQSRRARRAPQDCSARPARWRAHAELRPDRFSRNCAAAAPRVARGL
jgi:hypothetical protein